MTFKEYIAENDFNPSGFFGMGYNLTNLEGIEKYESVTSLDLSDNLLTDISPLTKLTKLENLNLKNNLIKDISPLAKLKNLRTLNLNKNPIENYFPLIELKSLEILNIECNIVGDLDFLAKMKSLKFLYVSSPFLEDISGLSELNNLKGLSISNTSNQFERYKEGNNCTTIMHLKSLLDFNYKKNIGYNMARAILKSNSLKSVNGLSIRTIRKKLKYGTNISILLQNI